MEIYDPFSRPMYVMLKPAGSLCNLRCKYCYYLEKRKLYQQNPNNIISDHMLEKFIKEYIEAQSTPQVLFTWHGGETLMRPIAFYKRALELQRIYGRGRQIDNCIQTNGTLITDKWCEFFKENNFLVGVSIDGPQEFHDEYRRTSMGQPTFLKVMAGIKLLNKHKVEWNALAVVNDFNADYPLDFYNLFRDIECRHTQFSPTVERIVNRPDGLTLAPGMTPGGTLTDFSVTPEQWGNFLCTIFDEWVKTDVGTYFVQIFDSTLANWVGEQPGVCTLAKECGHAGVMEFNGDVYSCDHFVYPEYRLGNLATRTITEMMYSEQQNQFARLKHQLLPQQCRECQFEFACHGECPKNRFVDDCYGNPGLNYLCQGYHQFFSHVAPYMDFMKRELDAKRPPANIMSHLDEIRQAAK